MPVSAPTPPPRVHTPFDRDFWYSDAFWLVLADVVKIVIIYLLLRLMLRRLVDRVLRPALEQNERRMDAAQASRIKTLAGLVNSSISYTLTFVFGIMLLKALRLDPLPLLTTASVAGLAVGFGAQKLVKDMISGFFILLENQYGVGDYVTVGAVTGTVEEVGLRTTRIRDDAGKLYILSNGDITQVCNQSRGAVASFVEIGVAAATDIGQGDGHHQHSRRGTGPAAARFRLCRAAARAGIGRDGRRQTHPARLLPRHRPRQTHRRRRSPCAA